VTEHARSLFALLVVAIAGAWLLWTERRSQ
jgi:hypothetical protein